MEKYTPPFGRDPVVLSALAALKPDYVSDEVGMQLCEQLSRKTGVYRSLIEFEEISSDPLLCQASIAIRSAFHIARDEYRDFCSIKILLCRSPDPIMQASKVDDHNFVISVSIGFLYSNDIKISQIISLSEVRKLFPIDGDIETCTAREFLNGKSLGISILAELSIKNQIFSQSFLMLCLFHEICHVINGHLDILELYDGQGRVAINRLREVLEFDADCFSIEKLVNFIKGSKAFNSYIDGDLIKLSSFLSIVLSPFLDFRGERNESSVNLSEITGLLQNGYGPHPHHSFRFLYCSDNVSRILFGEIINESMWCDILSKDLIFKMFLRSYKFSINGNLNDIDQDLFQFFAICVEMYKISLEAEWESIRDYLESKKRRRNSIAGISPCSPERVQSLCEDLVEVDRKLRNRYCS